MSSIARCDGLDIGDTREDELLPSDDRRSWVLVVELLDNRRAQLLLPPPPPSPPSLLSERPFQALTLVLLPLLAIFTIHEGIGSRGRHAATSKLLPEGAMPRTLSGGADLPGTPHCLGQRRG